MNMSSCAGQMARAAAATATLLAALLIGGESRATVTAAVEKETKLYAEEVPVLKTIKTGTCVEMVEQKGRWYKVRVEDALGGPVEGLVLASVFVGKGDVLQALRDTPLYATERPVLTTIPQGTDVEVLRIVKGGYVVCYSPADGEAQVGLVATTVIPETEEIRAWRQKLAEAAAQKAKEEAKARRFEALYQAWKHRYALVDGEYVRLPEFHGLFDERGRVHRACTVCGGKGFIACPRCGGSGTVTKEKTTTCPWCGGTGKLHLSPGPCTRCGGTGKMRQHVSVQCDRCKGRGRVSCPQCSGTGEFTADLGLLGVGKFGTLPRCSVQQVLDETHMLVEFHGVLLWFAGWSTEDLVNGTPLAGFQIAIIGTTQYVTVMGSTNTVLRAIPLSQVKQGLTRKQFVELLEQKGGAGGL